MNTPSPPPPVVRQDPQAWSAGYKAGHSGASTSPPPGVDALAWASGVIEGQADRQAGKVRPATRRPPYDIPLRPAMNSTVEHLLDAVASLAALAEGREPDRARVLVGALALKTLCERNPSPGRDLLDAAAGLEVIATGGSLDLDAAGRARAAHFAALVRQIAGPPAP